MLGLLKFKDALRKAAWRSSRVAQVYAAIKQYLLSSGSNISNNSARKSRKRHRYPFSSPLRAAYEQMGVRVMLSKPFDVALLRTAVNQLVT